MIYASFAFMSLFAGVLANGLIPSVGLPLLLAGFIGYLVFGGKAMAFSPVQVEGSLARGSKPYRPTPTHRLAAVVAFSLLVLPAASMTAQQTVFNVPSDSVLDPGKVYLEADELFRPTEPKFSSTTIRGVVGLFPRVEGGVNFGG